MPPAAYRYPVSNPDFSIDHQGWGMPDLQALYGAHSGMVIIDETVLLSPLQTWNMVVTTPGNAPLKVTMVYRDPPGDPNSQVHRINDLDLVVTAGDGGLYYGNAGLSEDLWSITGGQGGRPDDLDTVENVFIKHAVAGNWTISVKATDVNTTVVDTSNVPLAHFALVISGVGPLPVMYNPDWNRDGAVGLDDLQSFLAAFANGRADADGDGITGPSDVATYVGAFLSDLAGGGRS